MSGPWFPDRSTTRVLLIGTAHYDNSGLPGIDAVAKNLESLERALTDPDVGLLDEPDHCRVLLDASDQAAVGAALAWAVREADSLLLVYYAGHGVLDDDGLLHLALRTTDPEHTGFSAVPMELLKRNIGRARAQARVLLLDCCFSGRAVSAMAQPDSLVSGQLDMTGTYVLTSTTATAPSHAPAGSAYTAFTGALLRALSVPEPLTLDGIHEYVDRELAGLGLPRPQCRSVGAARHLALVRGPVAERRHVRERPQGEASFDIVRPAQITKGNVGACLLLAVLAFALAWVLAWDVLRYPATVAAAAGLFVFWLGYGSIVTSYWRRLVVDADGLSAEGRKGVHQRAWEDIARLTLVEPESPPGRLSAAAHLVIRLRPDTELNNEVHPLPNDGGYAWHLGTFRLPTDELLAALRAYAPVGIRVERKRFAPPGTTASAPSASQTGPAADSAADPGESYRAPRRRSALVFLALTAATVASAEYLDRRNTPAALTGHTDDVVCVRFNANGTLLASGGDDKSVRVWDPHTHHNTRTFTGHESEIESVRFADDYTVVSCDGETLRCWDVNDSRDPVVITTSWARLNGYVAAGPGDPAGDHRRLLLWDVRTGRLQGSLAGHSGAVTSCAWSGSGGYLVTGCLDGTLRLWNAVTRKATATLKGPESSVDAVLFGPDGNTVISAGDDGTVRIWDIRTGGVVAVFRTGEVKSLGYGNQGRTLYCMNSSGKLRLWDWATRKPVAALQVDSLYADTLSAWQGTLVLGQEGTVRLVDMGTGRSRALPVPFMPWGASTGFRVSGTAIASDGLTIAAGCTDDRIRLWKRDSTGAVF
ncbi:caspase, EACC1-associated type [Streptomyces mexicanus]|uniref:Caspase family protein n=1 Tax=Streptomyces mexicanus TaxID=178566 RepID=A0A7X1LPH2_9ACTN|nr:caspase family protein [Streptomyces mexicanus]MBC2864487.1 caspase family protein [Streptomyces mexicanus]